MAGRSRVLLNGEHCSACGRILKYPLEERCWCGVQTPEKPLSQASREYLAAFELWLHASPPTRATALELRVRTFRRLMGD